MVAQVEVVQSVSRSLRDFGSLFHSSSNVTPFSCSCASVRRRLVYGI